MLVTQVPRVAAAEPAIAVMNSRRLIGHLIFGSVLSNYNHGQPFLAKTIDDVMLS
jgi:hypothetical protein